jgi:hypothetical protein
MKSTRLTMTQALTRFLITQYIEVDGEKHQFFAGVLWSSAQAVRKSMLENRPVKCSEIE